MLLCDTGYQDLIVIYISPVANEWVGVWVHYLRLCLCRFVSFWVCQMLIFRKQTIEVTMRGTETRPPFFPIKCSLFGLAIWTSCFKLYLILLTEGTPCKIFCLVRKYNVSFLSNSHVPPSKMLYNHKYLVFWSVTINCLSSHPARES